MDQNKNEAENLISFPRKSHKVSSWKRLLWVWQMWHDYKASKKDRLNTHRKSVHDQSKFQCEQCNYKASRKDHLQSHVKSQHDKNQMNIEIFLKNIQLKRLNDFSTFSALNFCDIWAICHKRQCPKSVKMFLERVFELRPHITKYYKFENLKKLDYRLHFWKK